MSVQRQLAVFALVAATAFASTPAHAAAVNDTQDRWTQRQQERAATNALWLCANVSLLTSLPANLQAATASPVRSESIAYWGWYGPGYRYGYWGPRPYRNYGYYRGYAAPYNTYYGGYPGYYYGPQVGVRVYPSGRVWRGYW